MADRPQHGFPAKFVETIGSINKEDSGGVIGVA
jgi:hypothetical protein